MIVVVDETLLRRIERNVAYSLAPRFVLSHAELLALVAEIRRLRGVA